MDPQRDAPTAAAYRHAHDSPDFADLRYRLRRFVFPMSVAFLLWYLSFVLGASFFPEVMAHPVLGRINVGLVLGLLQFVSTFAITIAYGRYAARHIDPAAARLRCWLEEVGR